MLSLSAVAGGVLSAGLLAACGSGVGGSSGSAARPAAKGQPTLVSTVLPTAVPAGDVRPTRAATPAANGTPAVVPTAPAPTATPSVGAPRELVILQDAEPTTLDPHRSTLPADATASFALFDTLTFRNEDQSVIRPLLATEWKVQDRRWELRLRPNVPFHDGSTLTSADVRFSIERTLDASAKTAVTALFSTVDRIESPDPLTVAFVTRQPDPLLPARLASFGGQIVPKAYLQRVGPDEFARRPIGTGPYRFLQWTRDDHLVLGRFDGYWGGAPQFSQIVVRGRADGAARAAGLVAGEVGLALQLPAQQLDAVQRSNRARVDGVLVNGLHVLAVNVRVAPLDRPLVRQALSLAIDRETLIKTVHREQGVVPNGLIAQGDFGFDATLPPLEYHQGRARQRLQAAGYAGEPVTLETTDGYLTGDREMASLIDGMWRAVGINSRVEVITAEQRAARLRDASFKGLFWADPASPLLDPDSMMVRLLGPGGAPEQWQHPEWQQLGAEARSSLDRELRLRNYRRMNEIGLEQLPWIPVVQPRRLYGIANTVDFRPYGTGILNLRRENLKPRA
ncbi:MAG: hypothetical protein IT306_09030 [Chloroflexi bacterium]|nr:hypothetical protein [Chloroflexota bacterium]